MIGLEVEQLTIAEIAPKIRAKQISALELTESFIERIERFNPRLNAY